MKLLHVADLHYGVTTHSRIGEDGLPSALVSADRCFGAAIEAGVQAEVDLAIVAGDIFHGPNPSTDAIVLFGARLRELRLAHIPTLIYPGNHDRSPRGGPSILSAFAGWGVDVVETAEVALTANMRIGVLPSVSRHRVALRSGLGRTATDELVVEHLRAIVDGWRKLDLDIVTGHWPVAGSMLGGEKDIAIVDEPMLSPADLEGPWAYVAMGHIHRFQVLRGSPPIGYAGAIDRTSFGEEDYSPAAAIVTIGDKDISINPAPLPARVFRTIELPTTDHGRDMAAASSGGVLRIVGSYPEERFSSVLEMARKYQATLYDAGAEIVRLELKAVPKDRVRSEAVAQATGPREALDAWLENNADESDRSLARTVADGIIRSSDGMALGR